MAEKRGEKKEKRRTVIRIGSGLKIDGQKAFSAGQIKFNNQYFPIKLDFTLYCFRCCQLNRAIEAARRKTKKRDYYTRYTFSNQNQSFYDSRRQLNNFVSSAKFPLSSSVD
jgi:hypothetical protein